MVEAIGEEMKRMTMLDGNNHDQKCEAERSATHLSEHCGASDQIYLN